MSIIQGSGGVMGGAASSTPAIQNSLRFRGSATAYCNRSFTTPTTQNKWTFSVWFKIGAIDEYTMFCTSTVADTIYRHTNGKLYFFTNGSAECYLITSRVFRDPAAWMHLVIAYDTSQATAANRARMYINGVEETSFTTSTYPSLNASAATFNTAVTHWLGRNTASWDGLMANVCFVDGQQLTPSAFGATDSTSGEWKPKTSAAIRTAVSSFGTNGFMLMFNDATSTTTLGYDRKTSDTATGGNNWTLNNFSVTSGVTYDAFIDSPNNGSSATQPVGNYATWHPLTASGSATFSEANTKASSSSVSTSALATLCIPTSGKFYCEFFIGSIATNGWVGLTTFAANNASSGGGNEAVKVVYKGTTGDKILDTTVTAYGATYTANDVIGMAVDVDGGTVTFYKNNSSQGSITYATSAGTFTPYAYIYNGNVSLNCGQRPFAYTPPTGFKALCTSNLGTPAIANPAAHFFAKTRTGTGASYSVTGLSFSPELVWVKGRSGATDHALYDLVRGVQKDVASNTTAAQTTETQGVTAFNSDGYTGGTLAKINTNAATYIDWMWNGGGSGVSNTDGSQTTTVSANTTAGISIVTATAQGSGTGTFGHGLGVAPKMIITKATGVVDVWRTYHASIGNTGSVNLNDTAATATSANYWNNTSPTSTVFTLGTGFAGNGAYVFYCFAEITGFSKFGSYTGNGSADGTFVFCGFRPRWILFKNIATAGTSWNIVDTARSTYNVTDSNLYPNLSDADTAGLPKDILSNGFKLRGTSNNDNQAATTFIFAAFAESPLQYANAR